MLAPKRSTKVTVVAISAVLAGCGGSSGSSGSGVSASAYVKSICSSIVPFEKDVQSRSSALNLSTITNASQGKTALVAFLGAVATDTDHAVTQLKAAGTPNVANGKTIATGIVNAFAQLKSALGTATTQANSLPTSSPAAFKAAANTLGTAVRTSMTGIGAGLSGLKSQALEKAAAKEPTCTTLAG